MAEVWIKRCQRQNDLYKFETEECEVRMFPSMPVWDAVYPSKVPCISLEWVITGIHTVQTCDCKEILTSFTSKQTVNPGVHTFDLGCTTPQI